MYVTLSVAKLGVWFWLVLLIRVFDNDNQKLNVYIGLFEINLDLLICQILFGIDLWLSNYWFSYKIDVILLNEWVYFKLYNKSPVLRTSRCYLLFSSFHLFLLYTIIEVIHHTKTHVKGTLILYVQTPQYFVFHWIGEKEGEREKELVRVVKWNFARRSKTACSYNVRV